MSAYSRLPTAISQAGLKVSTSTKAQSGENAPVAARYTTGQIMALHADCEARLVPVNSGKTKVFHDSRPAPLSELAPTVELTQLPYRAPAAQPAEPVAAKTVICCMAPLASVRPRQVLQTVAPSTENLDVTVLRVVKAVKARMPETDCGLVKAPSAVTGRKQSAEDLPSDVEDKAKPLHPKRRKLAQPQTVTDVAKPSGLKRRISVVETERMVQPKLTEGSSVSHSESVEDKASSVISDSDSADLQATLVERDVPTEIKHRRIAKPSQVFSTHRTLAGQAGKALSFDPKGAIVLVKVDDDEVEDRDWADIGEDHKKDPMMVTEYISEIIEYMREHEPTTMPNADYMDDQKGLNWDMHYTLVNWLVQAYYQLRMKPETLFLAVNIIDRYLSNRQVTVPKFQLIGITALWIACKYEESKVPHTDDLIFLTGGSYTAKEIFDTEITILTGIDFDLSFPNPMTYRRRVSQADEYNIQTRMVAKYFMEICLLDHQMIEFAPSRIATATIYLARKMLESGPWNAGLSHYLY
ncbi:G2/mitotic-specific cyclin [Coemansia aciculifera]|nr:G2/mitotic-specific cyclin [Coemansia aciculifera]